MSDRTACIFDLQVLSKSVWWFWSRIIWANISSPLCTHSVHRV